MIRAFVAVDISDRQREEVAGVLESMMGYDVRVKWVKIENVHVTLKFLGDTDEGILPDMYAAIGESLSDHSAFELSLEKLGCFPNVHRPRIIWIGIKNGYENLRGLSQEVERAVEPFGFRPEKRKFSVHLTVGRVKDSRSIEPLIRDISRMDFSSSAATISKVVFYRSILRPQGPIYTSLKEFELISQDRRI
jgi:2'-5' RNA ligase